MIAHGVTCLLAAFFFIASIHSAFALNDDQVGPHGGVLQAAGSFHAELRSLSNTRLVLYLLDELHKNPTAENSSVGVMLRAKNRDSGLNCEKKDNHFDCETAQGILMSEGDEIIINATRKGIYGGAVFYRVPLQSTASYAIERR